MTLRKAFAVLACMLSGFVAVAGAQSGMQPPPPPSAAPQPQQERSLLVGPGDMLHIVVFDAPELEQHGRVDDEGNFPLLMGGNVKLAGLSPDDAANVIMKRLVDLHYLVNPHVYVNVEQFATQNVSVIGEVQRPGAYPITTGRSVAEVVALAGGLTPAADRNIVVERHATGKLETYYLSNNPTDVPDAVGPGAHLDKTTLVKRDTEIFPGDTVRVARAALVYALGDVRTPSGVPLYLNDAHLTVLQLVAMVGGTNKSAVPAKARIIRRLPDGGYQQIMIPLSNMQKGKAPDMALQANDILYVPFSYLRNAALSASAIAASATASSISVQ